MDGDLLTQGRNAKNLIETVREITELMDLKKDRLRDEQIRLTRAQTQLVTTAIEAIQVGMLEKVVELLPEESREAVEQMWGEVFPAMAADAIARNKAAIVKMGGASTDGPLELEPVLEEFD